MSLRPSVDVNVFVFNAAATIVEVLDSLRGQSWSELAITVIDNASTDDTCALVEGIALRDSRVALLRSPINVGPVINCQRAFWHGQSAFVLPKTGDDLLAPDFVSATIDALRDDAATAMCHAAGLVFDGSGTVQHIYPPGHALDAVAPDPLARARHVMTHYTSAPAFWGLYRRTAVARLAPLAYRPGWDHAVLAELALYGAIRSVAQPLFWRRHGGKDVGELARGCSQFTQRGLGLDDTLADLFWRLPLVATAYGHFERFAVAQLSTADRHALMDDVPAIFRARWLPMMRQEAARFRTHLPMLLDRARGTPGAASLWAARQVGEALLALQTILPDEDFTSERIMLHACSAGTSEATGLLVV